MECLVEPRSERSTYDVEGFAFVRSIFAFVRNAHDPVAYTCILSQKQNCKVTCQLFLETTLMYIRHLLTKTNKDKPHFTLSDLNWLNEVERLIMANIGNRSYRLRDLAFDLQMSPKSLQIKMKQLTGLTPKSFQRNIELEYARRILYAGECQTVSKLSSLVGFEDQHYFSKLYCKQFGLTPKQELELIR